MPERRSLFSPLVFLYSAAVLCVFLAGLFSSAGRTQGQTVSVNAWALPLAVMASYLLNRLLLRRERTVPQLVIVNALLYGLTLFSAFKTGVFATLLGIIFAVIVCGALQALSCVYCLHPPLPQKYVGRLELMLSALVIATLYRTVTAAEYPLDPLLLSAAAACLLLTVYRRLANATRAAGGSRLRGFVTVLSATAALTLLLLLFMTYLSAPLGNGVAALYEAVLWLLKTVGRLVGQFIFWLASLFPAPTYELALEKGAALEVGGDMEGVAAGGNVLILIACAVGAALVLVGVVFLIRIRRRKFSLPRISVSSRPVESRRGSFFAACRGAAQRLLAAVRREYLLIVYRNTPQGLLIAAERRLRHTCLQRRAGDTPRAFLLRLDALSAGRPGAWQALADAVDTACFGARQPRWPHYPAAPEIRRELGRLLRFSWGKGHKGADGRAATAE